jgi:hypothetical protein
MPAAIMKVDARPAAWEVWLAISPNSLPNPPPSLPPFFCDWLFLLSGMSIPKGADVRSQAAAVGHDL